MAKKRKPVSPLLTIKAVKAKGYSPAYEKRLIRNIRKARKEGKKPSRQLARGHKPKEHIERKEKEKQRLGGLTADQIRIIIHWHQTKFNPHGYREVPTEEELVEWSRENGYARFKLYRATWDAARRVYIREQGEGTYESRGMGYLYRLTGMAKAETYQWLYYH
jgi:hypothetical protein